MIVAKEGKGRGGEHSPSQICRLDEAYSTMFCTINVEHNFFFIVPRVLLAKKSKKIIILVYI